MPTPENLPPLSNPSEQPQQTNPFRLKTEKIINELYVPRGPRPKPKGRYEKIITDNPESSCMTQEELKKESEWIKNALKEDKSSKKKKIENA